MYHPPGLDPDLSRGLETAHIRYKSPEADGECPLGRYEIQITWCGWRMPNQWRLEPKCLGRKIQLVQDALVGTGGQYLTCPSVEKILEGIGTLRSPDIGGNRNPKKSWYWREEDPKQACQYSKIYINIYRDVYEITQKRIYSDIAENSDTRVAISQWAIISQ